VRLLPVDYLLALYNLLMIGVWTPLAPTLSTARWMIVVHLVGLGLVWLLARGPVSESGVVRAVREVYPILWLMVFWRELGIHCELVGSAPNDTLLAAVDRSLLGVNLSAVWAPTMSMGWFSELMQLVYFSYYVAFVGLVLYLLVRGNRETARDVTLRVSAVYVACFIVYAIAPTIGPMAMFPRFSGEGVHGLFRTLNDALQASGDAAGTAFPSTHVAGAITLAWLAWRHCPRWCAWLVTAVAVGVAPATIYTQNHFLVDAVAAVALAFWLQGYGVPALQGATRARLVPTLGRPATVPKSEPEVA
jgi:hypothetical protein